MHIYILISIFFYRYVLVFLKSTLSKHQFTMIRKRGRENRIELIKFDPYGEYFFFFLFQNFYNCYFNFGVPLLSNVKKIKILAE